MSKYDRATVSVTTDSAGDATVYSPRFTGRIVNIIYTKTDFEAGVDLTITLEATGQTVWTESNVDATKTVAPGQATHSNAGVAAVFGSDAVLDYIVAANDRIQIVVGSGGDTKTGSFEIVIEGDFYRAD